jgi:hypothetical protein
MRLESDPKLKKQFEINAHSKYKGVSDDTFKSQYKELITADKTRIESELVEKKAELLKYPKDSAEYLKTEQTIKSKEQSLVGVNKMLQNPEQYYNRDVLQTKVYEDEVKKQIIDTYAKTDILGVKMDLIPEWVYKAQKEKTAPPEGLGVVTEKEKPYDNKTVENPLNETAKSMNTKYATARREVDKMMENDPAYSRMSEEQKKNFTNSIIKGGDEVHFGGDMPKGLTAAVADYRQEAIKYNEQEKKIVGHYDDVVKTAYNQLFNNYNGARSTNFDNLSKTLPNTVKAIVAGKSFEDLTAKEKAIVKADIATNIKSTTTDPLEKSTLERYRKRLIKDNPNTFTIKKKVPVNQPEQYEPIKREGSAPNAVVEWYEDYRNSAKEAGFNIGQNIKNWVKGAVNTTLYQDENLSEIGVWDVANISMMKGNISTLMNTLKETQEKETPTVKKQSVVTFNSEIKNEKDVVNTLKSLHRAKGGTGVFNTPFVSVELDLEKGVGYITADTKAQVEKESGRGLQVVWESKAAEVPLNELPIEVLRAHNLEKQQFAFSVKNPQKYEKTFVYTVAKTVDENVSRVNTVLKTHPLPASYETALLTNPKSAGLLTVDDYHKEYANRVPKDVIDKIVGAEYKVKVSKRQDVGFFYNVLVGGKVVSNTMPYINTRTGQPIETIDEADFLLKTPMIIDNYIKETIEKNATR